MQFQFFMEDSPCKIKRKPKSGSTFLSRAPRGSRNRLPYQVDVLRCPYWCPGFFFISPVFWSTFTERDIEIYTKCTLRGDNWATVTKIYLDSERALYLSPLNDASWIKQDKTLQPILTSLPNTTFVRATVALRRQIQISYLLCPTYCGKFRNAYSRKYPSKVKNKIY